MGYVSHTSKRQGGPEDLDCFHSKLMFKCKFTRLRMMFKRSKHSKLFRTFQISIFTSAVTARSGDRVISRAKVRSVQLTLVMSCVYLAGLAGNN